MHDRDAKFTMEFVEIIQSSDALVKSFKNLSLYLLAHAALANQHSPEGILFDSMRDFMSEHSATSVESGLYSVRTKLPTTDSMLRL